MYKMRPKNAQPVTCLNVMKIMFIGMIHVTTEKASRNGVILVVRIIHVLERFVPHNTQKSVIIIMSTG